MPKREPLLLPSSATVVDPAIEMAPKLSSDVIEKFWLGISNGSAGTICGGQGVDANEAVCTGTAG